MWAATHSRFFKGFELILIGRCRFQVFRYRFTTKIVVYVGTPAIYLRTHEWAFKVYRKRIGTQEKADYFYARDPYEVPW